jgi:hypothetical protein
MEDLNDILKLSGMQAKVNEAEVEEAYANEPDEEYQTVDTIIRQGTDLNREKQQVTILLLKKKAMRMKYVNLCFLLITMVNYTNNKVSLSCVTFHASGTKAYTIMT